MSTLDHAKKELQLLGYKLNEKKEGPNKWIVKNVLELLSVFVKQGHSGSSAPYCINLFSKLAKQEPVSPLTGKRNEWVKVTSGNSPLWQNKRCSHVFMGKDKKAYDIDGIIFREPNGACYTNIKSRVYVKFPYTPKSVYKNVKSSSNV